MSNGNDRVSDIVVIARHSIAITMQVLNFAIAPVKHAGVRIYSKLKRQQGKPCIRSIISWEHGKAKSL
ncbi:MAG: hypothetical protein ACXV7F_08570 [Methylomonas sp.]